ncbi:MAG: hypothetical protein QM642_05925 [Edaphocola sp.]
MHTGMLHLHSVLRYVLVMVAVWAIVKMASGRNGNRSFTAADKRPALLFLIFMDVQLLVGLFLYFTSPVWGFATLNNNATGVVMKDSAMRFFAVEHIAAMLIALVLVHIGYAATKKPIADKQKFNKAFWLFLVAFILMLASIPWPFREALHRGWIPQA